MASEEQVIELLTKLNTEVSTLNGTFNEFRKNQNLQHKDIKNDLDTLKDCVSEVQKDMVSSKSEMGWVNKEITDLQKKALTERQTKQINYTSLGTALIGLWEILKAFLTLA